jgi:hypothetical protein
MARKSTPFLLVLVLLLVIAYASYAVYYKMEGFQSYRCDYGITCPEGQFCQENVCKPIYPQVTNQFM